MDFTIDKDFRDLIPPLTPEEYEQLEKSILAEGVRDPLVVWANNGRSLLVDGHHRWSIIRKHSGVQYRVITRTFRDRDDAKVWIIDNQRGRRNLPRFTLCSLALLRSEILLKQQAKDNQKKALGRGKGLMNSSNLKPVHVDRELAKMAGVAPQTIQRVRFLNQNAEAQTLADLREGKVSIHEAFVATRHRYKKQELRASAHQALRSFGQFEPDEDLSIFHEDFREVAKTIADGSVDLILADPPYDLESVLLYGDLAQIASRILKVGGSLITYSGNRFLPEIFQVMTPHLQFYWTMACLHTCNIAHRRNNIGVVNEWKPLLWFVKGKREDREAFISDTIESEKDKRYHDHGQSLIEATYLIEHLTKLNDLVFDPFCGGGTTAVAAQQLKRRWITCDTDEQAVAIARKRMSDVLESAKDAAAIADQHQLICGDALKEMRKFPDATFDAIITDPPYGVGYTYDGRQELHDDPESYGQWLTPIIAEMQRVLRPGGFLAVFQSGKYFQYLWEWFGEDILIYAHCRNFTQIRSTMPINFGFDPLVVKYKAGAEPLRPKCPKRNLNFFVARSSRQLLDTDSHAAAHPCPRPLDQMEELVQNFVTEGGHVLDCFMGSGSTGVACLKHGRRFTGIERERKYVSLARKHLSDARKMIC